MTNPQIDLAAHALARLTRKPGDSYAATFNASLKAIREMTPFESESAEQLAARCKRWNPAPAELGIPAKESFGSSAPKHRPYGRKYGRVW